MIVKKLQVENLRNLQRVEITAHASINILFGANGAGKTSVLEAIAVLSRGRSFRGSRIAQLIGPLQDSLSVFAEISGEDAAGKGKGGQTKLGLQRSTKAWKARRDGTDLQQLSELAESLAVVVMEPNSHELISGSPEIRRRYLDWGVFHVEPRYLEAWQRYARALRQRNAALRAGERSVLPSLESVLVTAGEEMTALRAAYTAQLSEHLASLIPELSPDLGRVSVDYRRGWGGDGLKQALEDHREKDLERGSTQSGPHRADLAIKVEGHAVRDSVSRGEEKVLATALVLAQARRQCDTGRIPVVLLDDLASEFDRDHFAAALRMGMSLGVQMWITGVEEFDPGSPHSRFHVERGEVRKVV